MVKKKIHATKFHENRGVFFSTGGKIWPKSRFQWISSVLSEWALSFSVLKIFRLVFLFREHRLTVVKNKMFGIIAQSGSSRQKYKKTAQNLKCVRYMRLYKHIVVRKAFTSCVQKKDWIICKTYPKALTMVSNGHKYRYNTVTILIGSPMSSWCRVWNFYNCNIRLLKMRANDLRELKIKKLI